MFENSSGCAGGVRLCVVQCDEYSVKNEMENKEEAQIQLSHPHINKAFHVSLFVVFFVDQCTNMGC